jgi:hypothetical protein
VNALTVCACCDRPFQRGERIFRGALLTAGGCGLFRVCTGCRDLLEHDEGACDRLAQEVRGGIQLLAAEAEGRA